MGYKPLVCTEYEMDVDPGSSSHNPGDFGDFTVIEQKLDKALAEDNELLHTVLAWIVSPAGGCSYSGYTFTAGGGSLSADSEKCFGDTLGVKKCMKEKAQGTCNGMFFKYTPPATFEFYNCSCTMTFEKAGQDKVEGK